MTKELSANVQRSLRIVARYARLQRAQASFYEREQIGMTELGVREELAKVEPLVMLMALRTVVLEDVLTNRGMYDRTIEAAAEQTTAIMQELRDAKTLAAVGR